MEDTEAQQEEIESLLAFYGADKVLVGQVEGNDETTVQPLALGGEWRATAFTPKSRTLRVALSEQTHVLIHVPEHYPSSEPPTYEIIKGSKSDEDLLRRLVGDAEFTPGEPVLLYQCERLREALEDAKASSATTTTPTRAPAHKPSSFVIRRCCNPQTAVTVQKSQFLGFAAQAETPEEAKRILEACACSSSKMERATHHMWAYRLVSPSEHSEALVVKGDNDDGGEDTAGKRLAELLAILDARNVVVLVSRWYGGTHLGNARWKVILNVAREALVDLDQTPGPKILYKNL